MNDLSQLSAEERVFLKIELIRKEMERKTKALEEIAETECLVLSNGDDPIFCPHCIAKKALTSTE